MNASTSESSNKPHSVGASAVAGLVSATFGLGLAEVVAGLSARLRSPIVDVGDRVVDRVPVWAKDLAIQLFGTNDKIALLVGIGLILAIYSAVVGIIALRKSFIAGLVGVGLFALIGSVAAAASRTATVWWSPLPTLVGAAGVAIALHLFTREPNVGSERGNGADGALLGMQHPSPRRRFLASAGLLTVGAAIAAATGRALDSRFSASASRAGQNLPNAEEVLPAVPAGAQAENAAPFITSNADFYRIDTALTVPQIPAESWKLTVKGMVERQLEISYEDLLNRPLIERDITLTCVSNTIGGELIGTARWLGTRLDDLLAEAGIDPNADQIVGRSSDGYTCGFPVAALDGRDALVAVAMNGEPLPLEHGFPARLIVPGLYGYVSATKWLTEIELTRFDEFDSYWVPRGYAAEAPIKLQSRIDTPRGLDKISAGPFVIGGVAWAQTIGIDAVEVKVDDGEWTPAVLAEEVNDITWRQWSFPWNAEPGRHSVSVRATDRNGVVQTDERVEPLPNGASGHHTVVVLVADA